MTLLTSIKDVFPEMNCQISAASFGPPHQRVPGPHGGRELRLNTYEVGRLKIRWGTVCRSVVSRMTEVTHRSLRNIFPNDIHQFPAVGALMDLQVAVMTVFDTGNDTFDVMVTVKSVL